MSLRIRLSLIVSLLFLTGLLLGLGFLMSNARTRVQEEVSSAAVLTWQLLGALLDTAPPGAVREHAAMLELLQGIDSARHLDLSIEGDNAELLLVRPAPPADRAPAWFTWLVRTESVRYVLPLDAAGHSNIVISTNAANEIAEVWGETRNFLVLLGLVLLCLNGCLYVILGRWLAPVRNIVERLDDVEHGNFSGVVSPATLPELKVIVEKLNHLTTVLRDSKAQNDRLTRRALAVQEDERRVLARELHDELGQAISAIKAIAYLIAQRQQQGDARSMEGANRITAITDTLGTRVRSMMRRLRPAILDELGLVAALQVMVDEWNLDYPDIFCSFYADPDFRQGDAERQIHLYRIVQEALTNVVRHAGAERVEVSLTQDAAGYRLRISDNGAGFAPALLRRGMGLSGIEERCRALGAVLTLVAAPGQGVRLDVVGQEERPHE